MTNGEKHRDEIAALCRRAKYADAYFALKESLELLFGRPVDLVTEGKLENPYFRDRVYAERKLVHAR